MVLSTGILFAEESNNYSVHEKRWYTDTDINNGEPLYQKYCSGCHMPDASGVVGLERTNLKKRSLPPPLNGTAHTWQHSLSVLKRIILGGEKSTDRIMPEFNGILTSKETLSILAWLQSRWTAEVYEKWEKPNSESGVLNLSDIF